MLRTSRPNHFAQPSHLRLAPALKASSAQKTLSGHSARYNGAGTRTAVAFLTPDPKGSGR